MPEIDLSKLGVPAAAVLVNKLYINNYCYYHSKPGNLAGYRIFNGDYRARLLVYA